MAYVAEVNGILQIFQRDPLIPITLAGDRSAYDCKYPFWSPDGSRIYYVSRAQEREAIWSVLVGGGKPQVVVLNAVAGRDLTGRSDASRSFATKARPTSSAPSRSTSRRRRRAHRGRGTPWKPPRRSMRRSRSDVLSKARWRSPLTAARLVFSAIGEWNNPERWWQFWIVPLPGGPPSRRLEWLNLDVAPRVSSFSWMSDSRHIVLGLISLVVVPLASVDGRSQERSRMGDHEYSGR